MRLLFVADVVAGTGREACRQLVPRLRKPAAEGGEGVDFVVANGENMAGGLGITPDLAQELFDSGVNVITSGNHIFRRKEILPYLDGEPRLLRPANYPARLPGKGWGRYRYGLPGGAGGEVGEGELAVVSLLGTVYIDGGNDPVECMDALLAGLLSNVKTVLVDFHAEATAEKAGLLRYLDGRVSALIGTHTHVQTSDETVTAAGTAFITDAGMTGPEDSVIGLEPEIALRRLTTGLPQAFKPAHGRSKLEGVIIDIDPAAGRARAIQRLRLPWPAV